MNKLSLAPCLAVALLFACNGEDSPKPDSGDSDSLTVAGTLTAPSGQIALFMKPSLGERLRSLFVATAHAQSESEGYLPVAGVAVTIEDFDGAVFGSATTDVGGHFSIETDTEPSPGMLLVAVNAAGTIELHAMYTDVVTDAQINPITEV